MVARRLHDNGAEYSAAAESGGDGAVTDAPSLYLPVFVAPAGELLMVSMEKLVSLCKRRGFVFASSEIYGGLNGCWDYGPLGVELTRNVKGDRKSVV